jgi:cell division protein ZapA
MPDLSLKIGDHNFKVTCQAGEEKILEAAAHLLNAEAQKLLNSNGRMLDNKMLLMAGLMLADQIIHLNEELDKISASSTSQDEITTHNGSQEPIEPQNLSELLKRLSKLAVRAESIAETFEKSQN